MSKKGKTGKSLKAENHQRTIILFYFLTVSLPLFQDLDPLTKEWHLRLTHLRKEQPHLHPRLLLHQHAGEISHEGSMKGVSNSE